MDKDERRLLERILCILERAFAITDFQIVQRKGDFMGAITGVQVGATGVFQILFVPANGVPLPTAPTVATTDTNVTLGAVSTDGQFTFTAAVAAGEAAASFPVTVSGTNAAGAPLSHTFNVPVLSAPPPQITDFDLSQLS